MSQVQLERSVATVAAAAAVLARHPEQVPSEPGKRLLHRLEAAAQDLAIGLPQAERDTLRGLLDEVGDRIRDRDFLYEHPCCFRAGVVALMEALSNEIQEMQPPRTRRAS